MTIGLLAIFRNEAHCIREFIEHYLAQGVDRFYLINNASEDDFLAEIEPYRDVIALYEEPHVPDTEFLCGGGRQIEAYNQVLREITTDWLIIQDLDEFTYAKNGYKTIKDFIEREGSQFDQYLMHLKPFTSGGVVKQPDSIVDGFTAGRMHLKAALTKPIVQTCMIDKIFINYCTLKSGGITVVGDMSYKTTSLFEKPDVTELINLRTISYENQFNNHPIQCNHYSVQSEEWYFNVKAKRGTATWHGGEYMPAEKWFARRWEELHNVFTSKDTELKQIKEGLQGE